MIGILLTTLPLLPRRRGETIRDCAIRSQLIRPRAPTDPDDPTPCVRSPGVTLTLERSSRNP
jgi:hypothetical protein